MQVIAGRSFPSADGSGSFDKSKNEIIHDLRESAASSSSWEPQSSKRWDTWDYAHGSSKWWDTWDYTYESWGDPNQWEDNKNEDSDSWGNWTEHGKWTKSTTQEEWGGRDAQPWKDEGQRWQSTWDAHDWQDDGHEWQDDERQDQHETWTGDSKESNDVPETKVKEEPEDMGKESPEDVVQVDSTTDTTSKRQQVFERAGFKRRRGGKNQEFYSRLYNRW